MANDPRANTQLWKQCPPSYLGKAGAIITSATSDRQKFFNGVGKVGDLEVLNNRNIFGSEGSRVGQGLRTLTSISNSVRTGCGALPTVIGSAVGGALDTGTDWVLENIGFSKTLVDQAQYFSPAVANQAYGQARQIFERVQQGEFRAQDIPSVLQDFQNLERLARNIYNPPASVQSKFKDICEASPYAIDFAFRAPKYKFLFLVQVIFNPGYAPLEGLNFTFMVKNSTRPNLQIEMEDVNYYNFRSKVITRTKFEDMTMAFHDDGLNFGMRFWAAYMKATVPIANLSQWNNLVNAEDNGMAFTPGTQTLLGEQDVGTLVPNTNVVIDNVGIPGNFYTASRGPLVQDNKTIIQEIRLFHIFDWGQKMNVFKFFNPRIGNLQLDNVDMSVNEVTEFQMTFNYDSVFVETDVPIDSKEYNIEQQQRGAFYTLKNVTSGANSGPSNIGFVPEAQPTNPADCNPAGRQNTTVPPAGPVTNNPFISGGGIGGFIGTPD